MGTVHPQIGRLPVHHVAELQRVASDMLGQGVCCIIVAHQHHLVYQVVQPVAVAQPDSGVFGNKHVIGDIDGICRVAILKCQQTGHHFGEGGHKFRLIGILLADDHTR